MLQDARLYLDPVRECYEAYVIYNFYAYLVNFLEVRNGTMRGQLEGCGLGAGSHILYGGRGRLGFLLGWVEERGLWRMRSDRRG